MSTLKFKKADVIKLLTVLKKEDRITLVGDHGVYLMSFGEKKILPEDGSRTLAFAEGCDPDVDGDEAHDNKNDLYGGDDGGDDIGTAQELTAMVVKAKSHIVIKLTATQIKISYN